MIRRIRIFRISLLGLVACLVLAAPARAQEDLERRITELERQVELLRLELAGQDSALVARLVRQIDALTREIERLKLGQEVVVEAAEGQYGFGPAASKVYQVQRGVSIGGYGELLYENFDSRREDDAPSGKTDQIDFLRAIVYVGYKFDERFVFNSEIEFEHSSTGNAGSVSLEFAYLDWLVSDAVSFRAGLLLAPMGFINELHEPPTFLSTERPETEQRIIPSTWRENGIGVFGEPGDFSYRVYVMNGFDAIGGGSSDADGFSAAGLRGGRQKGSKAVAEDFALVGRVDYEGTLGLTVGGSAFVGRSGQDNRVVAGDFGTPEIDALTVITEGHAAYRARGIYLRGLLAFASVDEAALINQRLGLTGEASVGEGLLGWYLEGGYDVLNRVRTEHALVPFVRYEELNTQHEVPAGFQASGANDQRIVTLGVSWKPITNLVVKGDYQVRQNEAETGTDQFNLALGYLF